MSPVEGFDRLFNPFTGLPDFPELQPGEFMPVLVSLLHRNREVITAFLDRDEKASWEFVETETACSEAISRVWSPLSHLSAVADSDELRAQYNAGIKLLTEHDTWRQQHAGIYRIYRALRDSAEFTQLTAHQQRIIDLEIRDFHLAGVDLDEAGRDDYRRIRMRLSSLSTRFQENVLDATRAWQRHFDSSDALAGLPDADLRTLSGIAAAHGHTGWTVDLSDPAYLAVMTHATNRDLRRELYTAFTTRASDQGPFPGQWDNTPVIAEMLALRHELAELLGFANYPEYALSTRMAESTDRVLTFLNGLAEQAVPDAREQFSELERFAAARGAEVPLQPWDITFWSERYREVELRLSDEELKPFFPLESVLGALFHVVGRIFAVSLEVDSSVAAWHPDVRFYWVHDEDGERCAGLFLDSYARRDKRGGAWMDICQSRWAHDSQVQLPVAFLNCNFPPPSHGHPSLLTHHDVQTLFHEFGHGLHHMLTDVDLPQINGISNVEWDAVELPSQLLENWCWEEHLLDGFSRHYETGAPLPAELKRRLLRSRNFQRAMFLARQLEFAICDYRIHLEYDPARPRNPREILDEVRAACAVTKVPDWNRFLNGFSHVFSGGYAAGYYSYLWAEQLAADAWQRFLEEGTFNPRTGRSLREQIFAVGASRPAMESFTAFRGRAPRPEPLLHSYGLADTTPRSA